MRMSMSGTLANKHIFIFTMPPVAIRAQIGKGRHIPSTALANRLLLDAVTRPHVTIIDFFSIALPLSEHTSGDDFHYICSINDTVIGHVGKTMAKELLRQLCTISQ
jgi:hypothetical protein